MSFRHGLFRTGAEIVAGVRADQWLAPWVRGRGLVLAFHRVCPRRERSFAPNRFLEITPGYLEHILHLVREQGFELVSLDEIPGRLADPNGAPFAALTFDDGYRDNLEHAAPILARHNAPWTLFVTTTFAGGDGRLWWFELEEAVSRLDRIAIELDGQALDLPTHTVGEKMRAFELLFRRLGSGPEDILRRTVASLAAAAELEAGTLVRQLCLSWEELGALSRRPGVTIGAHTLSHPRLAKLPDDVAAHEIRESRQVIENQLGIPIRHFAFPYGGPTAAGPREFDLARMAGFRAAFTTRPGHLFPEHTGRPHALPRVQVNGMLQTDAALRAILLGIPFLLWKGGRRITIIPRRVV